MVLAKIFQEIGDAYTEIISSLPPMFQNFVSLFFLVLLILVYCVFIWKFYKFIGKKNIIEFNVEEEVDNEPSFFRKILNSLLYLVKYIFVIPFIAFFWFFVFTFFLILLVEESIQIETIIMVSAVAIASIRMCSYVPNYGENIAKELAKMLPFSFLGISVLNPKIFVNFIDRVVTRFGEISTFFSGIAGYIIFIIFLEVILRLFDFIFNVTGINLKEAPSDED